MKREVRRRGPVVGESGGEKRAAMGTGGRAVGPLLAAREGRPEPVRAEGQSELALAARGRRTLVDARAAGRAILAVVEDLGAAQLDAIEPAPGARRPDGIARFAAQVQAGEPGFVDLPGPLGRRRPGAGHTAISGRALQEDVELSRRRERRAVAGERRSAHRVGVRACVGVVRSVRHARRELPRILEVALRPVALHGEERGSRPSDRRLPVGGELRRAERSERCLRASRDLLSRRAGEKLQHAAERTRSVLRAQHAAAHHQSVEQHRRQRRQIDCSAARSLQRDAVEQHQRLVRRRAPQRKRRRLARPTQRVHADARRAEQHLGDAAHFPGELRRLDHRRLRSRGLGCGSGTLARDLDALARRRPLPLAVAARSRTPLLAVTARSRTLLRARQRRGEDGEQDCEAPESAGRRHAAPLFLSKR